MPVPVTQEQLRLREAALYDSYLAAGKSTDTYLAALAEDRRQRWDAWLAQMDVPSELTAWAAAMTMKHKAAHVKVYRNVLPWLLALLVVRYGEAEYFWPHEFGPDDLQRAENWYSGKDVPKDLDVIQGVA